MRRFPVVLVAGLLFGAVLCGSDPWTSDDLVQPAQAAADIRKDVDAALFIHVGFEALYHGAHIPRSVYAGPASTDQGIAELKKAVEGQPRGRQIVLYCGCCPWDRCPNIRPAFAALHEMGFTRVKAMVVPTNLKTDWIDKGYPADKSTDSAK
jgi:hypothetical protein